MAYDGSIKFDTSMDASGFQKGASSLTSFVKGLGAFELLKKGLDMVTSSIDSAVSRYDTLNNFPKIMQQMGYSAEESSAAVNRLSDGIQGLPTALDDIVSTAKQLTATTGDLNLATDTALALNNAFIASGASSDDASRGLQQYTQMLSSGKVNMQSWKTLNETMTYALQQTAESFGFAGSSAKNDLYKALQDGDITFDAFNARIIELSNKTGGFAEIALTASGGIKTAFTNMQTAITRGVTGIITAIDAGLANTPFESIENIISTFGKKLNAVLSGVAEKIPSLIATIGAVIEKLKPFAPVILTAASALLAFKAANAAVASATSLVSKAMGTLPGILAALSNPVVLIITVLSALAAAFVYLWNTNEDFRNKAIAVWEAVKSAISPVIEAIKGAISSLGNAVSTIGTAFAGLWSSPQPVLSVVVVGVSAFVSNFTQLFGGVLVTQLTAAINAIKIIIAGISGIVSGIINILSSAVDVLVGIFTGDADLIRQGFSGVLNGIKSVAQSFGTMIVGLFQNAINGVKGVFSSIGTFFQTAFSSIAAFITKTIPTVISNVLSLFAGLPAQIGAAISGLIGIIAEWGGNVWTTFTGWVGNIVTSVVTFFAELPANIGNAIGVAIATIASWCINVHSTITEGVVRAVTAAVTFFSELPGKVWNAIVGAVSRIQQWGAQMLSNAQSAASNVINGVATTLQNLPSRVWNAIVGAITSIVTWGVQMVSKARSAMENVKTTIVNTLKSIPSAVVSIGKNIVQGLWNGLKASASWLRDQITSFATGIIEGFKSAFSIHSPSRVMRDQVGLMMGLGLALGITKSTDRVLAASADLTNDTTKTLKDGFAKAGAESVLAMAKEANEKAENLSKDIVSHANDWLSTQEHFDRISAQQTVDFWEEILQITDLGTEEILDVEKKLYTAKQNLSKSSFEHSKKWIDNEKFYSRMSAKEEVEAWERVTKRKNLLAKEQLEAEKQLYTARQALIKEQQTEIDNLNKQYESAVSSLKSSVGGVFDLFKSGDASETPFTDALDSQIDALERYDAVLQQLAESGYSEEAIANITEGGIRKLADMERAANQSAEEILRMNEKIERRNALIGNQASLATIKAYGAENVLALVDGMTEEQKAVNENIVGMAQMAVDTASGYKTDFATVGTSLVQGIAEGISAGQGSVYRAVKTMANGMLAALRSALDIHSPSRAARKILQNFAPGMILGLQDGEKDVLNQMDHMGHNMLDRLEEITDEMAITFDSEIQLALNGTQNIVTQAANVGATRATIAPSVTKERYTNTTRTEVLGKITVDDRNLSPFGRALAGVVKFEEKRVGGRMLQGGAPI